MLASNEVRTYHHLWHLVRNKESWNGLTEGQREELIRLGWQHLHWSEQNPENPWDDSIDNDWLGAPYSSHVNNAFWKLHGWMDESITHWENAHDQQADFSTAWAGAPGHLPEMKHSADPQMLMSLAV